MKLTPDKKILIVGLGLLGGSYARSLTRQGYTVKCITRSQSTVDYALSEKMVEYATTKPDPALIGEADLIIIALYPNVFIKWIEEYGKYIKKGAFVTDVTGVKSCIVYRIQSMLPDGVEFIASHPMAGREVSGAQNSDDKIFKGANYIVTPTDKNTADGIDLCRSLGEILGFARISELSPEEHDEMIAFVSQLTHCIAVSLMNANADQKLCDYTGDSFRDLTRIARINEDMWSELFLLNKKALLHEIDAFETQLSRMRGYIEHGDAEGLKEMMRTSTERRSWFDKK
jgi:prephenate dehydrogenase